MAIARAHFLTGLLGLLLVASAVVDAAAASLTINPTSFRLTPQRPSAVMQVTNQSAEPVRLQVQAMAWTTDGKIEMLAETDQLMVNPPIFTLAGNETQTIRFGARDVALAPVERGYRLILDEVPANREVEPAGIRTVLKISTPVFIPALVPAEQVDWRVVQSAAGASLVATNTGNTHLKIIALKLAGSGTTALLVNTDLAYILPGQAREWPIKEKGADKGARKGVPTGPLQLRVRTETGDHEQTLSSGAP